MELQGPAKKPTVQSKEQPTPFRLLPAYVRDTASRGHKEPPREEGQKQLDLRAQIQSYLL